MKYIVAYQTPRGGKRYLESFGSGLTQVKARARKYSNTDSAQIDAENYTLSQQDRGIIAHIEAIK